MAFENVGTCGVERLNSVRWNERVDTFHTSRAEVQFLNLNVQFCLSLRNFERQ